MDIRIVNRTLDDRPTLDRLPCESLKEVFRHRMPGDKWHTLRVVGEHIAWSMSGGLVEIVGHDPASWKTRHLEDRYGLSGGWDGDALWSSTDAFYRYVPGHDPELLFSFPFKHRHGKRLRDGGAVVRRADDHLVGIDPSGEPRWERPAPKLVLDLATSDGSVLAHSLADELECFDSLTGEVRWAYPDIRATFVAVVDQVAWGRVKTPGEPASLRAFDLETGSVLGTAVHSTLADGLVVDAKAQAFASIGFRFVELDLLERPIGAAHGCEVDGHRTRRIGMAPMIPLEDGTVLSFEMRGGVVCAHRPGERGTPDRLWSDPDGATIKAAAVRQEELYLLTTNRDLVILRQP